MSDSASPLESSRPAPSLRQRVLGPLASLKLTVVLFAMSIVIVLAGTLAQVHADVWDVVEEYFRISPNQLSGSTADIGKAFFVCIPTRIFAPAAFFPTRPADTYRAKTPDGWTTTAIRPEDDEKGAYVTGSDPKAAARVSVSVGAHSLRDSVSHWVDEVGGSGKDVPRLVEKAEKRKVGDGEALVVQVDGPTESIVGAIIPGVQGAWEFKAIGPKAAVDGERAHFDSLVESATFPQWPSIYFPKGWVIGGLMLINLLSAHLIRFKLQARGARLIVGLWLLAVGFLVTWLVIVSGNNADGFQTDAWISYRRLWDFLMIGMLGLGLGSTWLGMRTGPEHKIERRLSFSAAAVLFGMFGWLMFAGVTFWQSDASMRILYQLVKGMVAGLVLLAGCQALFKKRAGIVLLHGGVAMLMMSEVLVGLRAVETKMHLAENQRLDYVFDTRHCELAVVDSSDANKDKVTVVPLSKLSKAGDHVSSDMLPFDIEAVRFLKNAVLPPALPPEKDNPATAGLGLKRQPREMGSSTGVSNEGSIDTPALYVKLTDKKSRADLGTWMTYVFEQPQTVTVDGKPYEIELRFERTYLPYSIKLLDVRKDDYIGTKTTRNYSSKIFLADDEKKTDQELTIWMNNPLRYRGQTFYQSGYQRDDRTGEEFTTLQVVSNTGWMIPYVSCMIVGVGMTYQFVLTLLRFLNRVRRDAPAVQMIAGDRKTPSPAQSGWEKWLPLAIVLLAALYVGSKASPPKAQPGQMDLVAFSKLPLAFEGRVKPFDSLARNSLLILSGKQEYKDKDGVKQPAIRWLLNVISSQPDARSERVFRITNLDLLKLLNLKTRDGFLYSIEDFADRFEAFETAHSAMARKPKESLTVYERSIGDLYADLTLFQRLQMAFEPPKFELPTDEEFKADQTAARAKMMSEMRDLAGRIQYIDEAQVPLAVPFPEDKTSEATATTGRWKPYSTEWVRSYVTAQLSREASEPPAQLVMMEKMLSSWRKGNVAGFNDSVHEYTGWLKSNKLEQLNLAKVHYEQFFNHFAPFYWSMVLCLFVFVLSIVGWLGLTEPLRRSAFWLMAFTFAVHTFALVSRIYISGRPPVTNLYSTGIFIGWAIVLFGLGCEWTYRIGVGNAVASIAGFITLGISHFLAEGGDTFTVLEAVLDTQFWLATHVVTINLGYAATAAAGLFGAYQILYGLSPKARPEVDKAVARMSYGSLCFAILFSFIGTVLGGLWADDSWGRFWGWDPKENGALIIVLWNCLVLHAKWDGMVKDRGLAVLTTLGLIAVSWSWFGTNQLGAGLHAYGFTNAARIGLFVTWGVALIIAGLGCLRRRGSASAA